MDFLSAPIPNIPHGKLALSSNQLNLVSGTSTQVQLNSVMPKFTDGIEDTFNYWIKPGKPGFYLVIGQVTFTSVVADKKYRCTLLHREDVGMSTGYAQDIKHSRTTDDLICRAVDEIWIGDDITKDAFELWATQFSGVNTVDISAGAPFTFLIARWLRP